MHKISKPHRRNLNDAFIALSDDDENLPSDQSANASDTASYPAKKTKKKLLQDNMLSSLEQSSYSTDYLARNFNMQTPCEFYTKNNKSGSKQCGKLKRSESLSAYKESQNKSKNVFFGKTRRSLESNNPPLVDISNVETPVFSRTSRRQKFENIFDTLTPKISNSEHSSEKGRVEKGIKRNKLQSRISYPECTAAKLNSQRHTQYMKERNIVLENNTDSGVPDPLTQVSLQAVRNLTGWRRVERNNMESFANLENTVQTDRQGYKTSSLENVFEESACSQICNEAATNDIERNTDCRVAFSTPNSAPNRPCCSFAPRKRRVSNTDVDYFKTQELRLENDLSAIPNCRQARIVQIQNGDLRNRHSNHLDIVNKVVNNHDFLKSHFRTKQKYYESEKVDLVKFEREARSEVESSELSSASEIKNGKHAYNIRGTERSPQRMILNIVQTENSPGNECRDCSNNSEINQFSEVKTPKSPISTLINKNLSELHVSKIINRMSLSQKKKTACGINTDCEDFSD